MQLIPIVIFAYNRTSHFKRVMIAIQNSKIKNKIYLILDGPKNKGDKIIQEDILGSVKTVGKFNKFKKNQIVVIKNTKNLGLAKSIAKGLDKISKRHKSFIVLEDDTVPYSRLVEFFTSCLKKYNKEEKIAAICGYQFMNFDKKSKKLKTVFLKHFIPWGWATWSKNWQAYRSNNIKFEKKYILKIPRFIRKIQKKVLIKKKKKNYWSLNYMQHNYLNNKYFVYPNHPLVKNIGFDGSGTNCIITNEFYVYEKKISKINLENFSLYKNDLLKHEKQLKKVIKNFYN